jgi:hypothetical protein
MKTAWLDRAFTVTMLGLGIYIVITSLQLGLYLDGVPGPGFFPIIAGTLMTVLAAALLMRDIIRKKRLDGEVDYLVIAAILGVTVGMIGFVYVAPFIGMSIAALLVMVGIGYITEEKKSRDRAFVMRLVAASVATVVVCHILFAKLIGVPLVLGPLGF